MRRVTLFDIDSRIPNPALMKLSGEKYLRWLNRLYYETFGRYYLPLVEFIYRYNNKHRIHRYLRNPTCLTRDLYRSFN